jgi:hypothetical protein
MPQYKFFNGPMPTTAAQLAVTTGTSIKTLLQVKGVTGIQAELCETGTVFGTVTAAVAADLAKWDDPNAPTPTTFFSVGTSATGYTCTSEGSITAVRMFDSQFVQPTNQYAWEFSLGNEPKIDAVSALRVRVKAAAAVNALAWVLLEV